MHEPQGFDYRYFDDPEGFGYRGYRRSAWARDSIAPWKHVANYCQGQGVKSVIDVGCAKGFLVEELLSRGIRTDGFDVSRYALSFASHLPCHQHDIRDGIGGRADAVTALGVLQYLDDIVEVGRAVTAIHGAARRLFLLSCHYSESRQVVPDPLRKITRPRQWWRDVAESVGFAFTSDECFFDVFLKV